MTKGEKIYIAIVFMVFVIALAASEAQIERLLQNQIDALNAINQTLIGDIPND